MLSLSPRRAVNAAPCKAIAEHLKMQLVYVWGHRVVERHAYGVGDEGQELLRAYQVSGASQSGEPVGWKLFRVDEIRTLHVLTDTFPGPPPGYRRNDRVMTRIYAQL
jgi:hypothetical protein